MIAPSFVGVILAAGESLRMGRDKALLPWEGATLLGAAIERLRPFTQMIFVVAGANADDLKSEVYARGAYLVVNPQPRVGQFSSLRVGLQEALNRGRDAAIVALVDRPPALAETIAAMLAAFHADVVQIADKWAVVPEFEGKHGHPIVIGREMIEIFLKAPTETTARAIEHAQQARILYLPVNDPAVVANMDTPQEYEQAQQHFGANI